MGGGFYVGARYRSSADFLSSKLKFVDKKTREEFLRTLVLDYAYLQDKVSFKLAVKKSLLLLDSLNSDDNGAVVSLLEALARSFSLFGYFTEAEKLLSLGDSFPSQPFYRSQIIRCRALVFYQKIIRGKKIDKNEFFSVIKRASSIEFAPYKRHQQQINNIVKKFELAYGKN